MDEKGLNELMNRSQKSVTSLIAKYHYPSNIGHLLYLIVPAFIIKYGIQNERYILNSFEQIPILIGTKEDTIYQAYYSAVPVEQDGKIITKKGIVLNHYQNTNLMHLLDNLVHEFNHAINSIKEEVLFDEKIVKVRTGICYILYDRKTLRPIKKEESSIIEEIINTKQTEMIIDIIHSFYHYEFTNSDFNSALYSIHSFINQRYQSDAYLLQSFVCKSLMENRTFISTLEKLRFDGNIEEVDDWFNHITGSPNSFSRLTFLLGETLKLQMDLTKKKGIRFLKIRKIRTLNQEAMHIVERFNQNCNYR